MRTATATGASDRIDDETRGIPLETRAAAPVAGRLNRAHDCYICKQPYTQVDAFYHQEFAGKIVSFVKAHRRLISRG